MKKTVKGGVKEKTTCRVFRPILNRPHNRVWTIFKKIILSKKTNKSFQCLLNNSPKSFRSIFRKISSGERVDETTKGFFEMQEELEINSKNVFNLMIMSLKYGMDRLLQRCILKISECRAPFVDIDNCKRLKFKLYNMVCTDYNKMSESSIDPILDILDRYAGIPKTSHKMLLNLLLGYETPHNIARFIEKYRHIVTQIEFGYSCELSDQLLFFICERCDSLESLRISAEYSCLDHEAFVSDEAFRNFSNLKKLESLFLEDLDHISYLNLEDVALLGDIQISKLNGARGISITNCIKLKRLQISACSDLEYISIENVPLLEEIVINQCHKARIENSLKEFPNLKICIFNDRKYL